MAARRNLLLVTSGLDPPAHFPLLPSSVSSAQRSPTGCKEIINGPGTKHALFPPIHMGLAIAFLSYKHLEMAAGVFGPSPSKGLG